MRKALGDFEEMMRGVGVDGCRAGWLAVTRAGGELDYAVFATMRDVIVAYQSAGRILVDVPIGLPWKGQPIRPCDRLARSILRRPRASSVFPVPCREALYAGSLADGRQANEAVLGRSIACQTWEICSKVREVDFLLAEHPSAKSVLREIHPEVCFWALAGGQPMQHRKDTAPGRNERLHVLASHESQAPGLLRRALSETRRKDVKADDILDALAAFVTAEASDMCLERLAGEPYRDQRGLAMEMLYLATNSQSTNLAVSGRRSRCSPRPLTAGVRRNEVETIFDFPGLLG